MRTRPKKLYLSKIIGRVRIGRTNGYYLCGRFQPRLFKAYEKVFYCLDSSSNMMLMYGLHVFIQNHALKCF